MQDPKKKPSKKPLPPPDVGGATSSIPDVAAQGMTKSFHQAAKEPPAALVPPAPVQEVPAPLGKLGHYHLQEVLRDDDIATTYKAFDPPLQRFVAVELLGPKLASSPAACQRFVREARASATVVHNNVVIVHAVNGDDLPYLVREFVAGITLEEKLKKTGPLGLSDIIHIGWQMAEGLAAAHAQGLIHGNLQPGYVLLEEGLDRVKIGRFGIGRVADDASQSRSGVLCGLPNYTSPEQAAGEDADARADLFSLGSILYALCTGHPPFRADSALGVLDRVVKAEARPVTSLQPTLPVWLGQLIGKLHAKSPEKRYQTAAEVAAVLRRHWQHLNQAALPEEEEPEPSQRSRLLPMIVGGGLVALLAMLAFVFYPRPEETPNPERPPGPIVEKPPTPPIEKPLPPEATPFVVLSPKGAAKRWPSLHEAVEAANSGDTIEIQGDGPFECPAMHLEQKSLRLRAAVGKRPVLRLAKESEVEHNFISSSGPLVVEGIEFQREGSPSDASQNSRLLYLRGPARLIGCRFVARQHGSCVFLSGFASVEMYSCELLQHDAAIAMIQLRPNPGSSFHLENSLLLGGAVGIETRIGANAPPLRVRLWNNTCLSRNLMLVAQSAAPTEPGSDTIRPLYFDLRGNLLHGPLLWFNVDYQVDGNPWTGENAEAECRKLASWIDRGNLHHGPGDLLQLTAAWRTITPTKERKTLEDFAAFWTPNAKSPSQRVDMTFTGGDLLSRSRQDLDRITPADFKSKDMKLADGSEYGAALDLVGPGPARERWAKTPAGVERLQAAETMLVEPYPFAVLEKQGRKERPCSTLREAVLAARDLDTIEVRATRPVPCEQTLILNRHITLKAAPSTRPVLRLDPRFPGRFMTVTNGTLVLSGLTLEADHPGEEQRRTLGLLAVQPGNVLVSGCRLVSSGSADAIMLMREANADIRSSEIICPNSTVLRWFPSGARPGEDIAGRVRLEGNVIHAGKSVFHRQILPLSRSRQDSLHVEGNTLLADSLLTLSAVRFAPLPGSIAPLQATLRRNVIAASRSVLPLESADPMKLATPETAEAFVRATVQLTDEQNLHGGPERWSRVLTGNPLTPLEGAKSPGSLAEWEQFWKLDKSGSVVAAPRFATDDVATKGMKLTASDVRLRAGTTGQGTGPGQTDLGAAIDLVGPSPAVERWQKTPAASDWEKVVTQRLREAQPFVLRGKPGQPDRRFVKLTDAVQAATTGDTIEIQADGPHIVPSLDLKGKSLAIRAGSEARPILALDPKEVLKPMFSVDRTLVLEGLELRYPGRPDYSDTNPGYDIIYAYSGSVYIANCRLLTMMFAAGVSAGKTCEIRNTEIYKRQTPFTALGAHLNAGTRFHLENNIVLADWLLWFQHGDSKKQPVSFTLRHNTIFSGWGIGYFVSDPADWLKEKMNPVTRFDVTGNIFESLRNPLFFSSVKGKQTATTAEMEDLLRHMVTWKEQANLYPPGRAPLGVGRDYTIRPDARAVRTLEDWDRLWGQEKTGSQQGTARYQYGSRRPIGDVLQWKTDMFRLADGSPGKGAGPDGRDMGANVDLVGPGEGFQQWKQTKDYDDWLKRTQEAIGGPPPSPFVVLPGMNGDERSYSTLVEAVEASRTGDTIEIRGNGPFLIPPMLIQRKALALRAGKGHRPVMELDPKFNDQEKTMLSSNAALVLEGLEMRRDSSKPNNTHLLNIHGPLLVRHCRLTNIGFGHTVNVNDSSLVELRNSEIISAKGAAVFCGLPSRGRIVIDQSLLLGGGSAWGCGLYSNPLDAMTMSITRSTLVGSAPFMAYLPRRAEGTPVPPKVQGSFQVETIACIFHGPSFFRMDSGLPREQGPREFLDFLSAWRWKDEGSLFGKPRPLLDLKGESYPDGKLPLLPDDWKTFWKSDANPTLLDEPKFIGGDLLKRLAMSEISPIADLHLAEGSPGKAADLTSKDVGADPRQIGPGVPHEMSIKSNEYKSWRGKVQSLLLPSR